MSKADAVACTNAGEEVNTCARWGLQRAERTHVRRKEFQISKRPDYLRGRQNPKRVTTASSIRPRETTRLSSSSHQKQWALICPEGKPRPSWVTGLWGAGVARRQAAPSEMMLVPSSRQIPQPAAPIPQIGLVSRPQHNPMGNMGSSPFYRLSCWFQKTIYGFPFCELILILIRETNSSRYDGILQFYH